MSKIEKQYCKGCDKHICSADIPVEGAVIGYSGYCNACHTYFKRRGIPLGRRGIFTNVYEIVNGVTKCVACMRPMYARGATVEPGTCVPQGPEHLCYRCNDLVLRYRKSNRSETAFVPAKECTKCFKLMTQKPDPTGTTVRFADQETCFRCKAKEFQKEKPVRKRIAKRVGISIDAGGQECTYCGTYRPYTDYGESTTNNSGYVGICTRCRTLRVHNVDPEWFYSREQVCESCGVSRSRNGNNLAIDHDHSCCPGKKSCGNCVRGLLCAECNFIAGISKDNPEVLRNVAKYLERTTNTV